MKSSTAFLAYIPVLHQGYLKFFQRHPEVKKLYLIGPEFLNQYRSIQKDLRALTPDQIKTSIEALHLFETVEILDLPSPAIAAEKIVSPDEDVSRDFIQTFWPNAEVEYDHIFLRWDRKRSLTNENVEPDVNISQDEFDQRMMTLAYEEASKSSDWWRQVGAVLVKDREVIAVVRNTHVPHDHQQYVDGDPRADFGSGEHIDLSTSLHAEAALIVAAAKKGISTQDCWMYATTFPCPYCAPIVARSGIKKLFYSEGYSMIEGEQMLKSKGVEIVKVERE
jgi:dCMP deaminase